MFARKFNVAAVFAGRVEKDEDLLGSLTALCAQTGCKSGFISAIGALRTAALAYYDQETGQYRDIALPAGSAPYEILQCHGNFSMKDGAIFCHIHLTVADRYGRAFGGHLKEGSAAWAFEFEITALDGEPLERAPDPDTGLSLWKKPDRP
jgi:predicted DNA-binding protein with PD1-like motif